MRKILLLLAAVCAVGWSSAQNMTDLAVTDNGNSGDEWMNISDVPAIPDSIFLHPDRVRYDHRCFQIEGKDVFIFSGTFHYFRVPQALWADRFNKLKAAGFNCVETYVPWNWHEREMPASYADESHIDLSQLQDFLKMAEEYDLYVILRPGPYICAEWDGGGYPQWLMQKRPLHTMFDVWLQSDDPEYLRWCDHWYRAVCKVAAPHQLTEKPAGSKGIILFQVENEFNRVKWFPHENKKNYLEQLAQMARKYGIEVPLITCWTDESRNVHTGALNGVVDMINSYPRWQVAQRFGGQVVPQMQSQPGKPLISGELQGGWCCELGWQLSWEQDGLPPVQTQNISLYALQRGFSALNYYMVVGGTNFDDWAARQQVTSYDYAAAIGEDGSLNERYRRFCGLGTFLLDHGTRIARANLVPLEYTSTDPSVEVALRVASNGDRYYFVRTEEHWRSHFGTVHLGDMELDFSLEPFGSQVYYMPAGAEEGEWFPKLPELSMRKATVKTVPELRKLAEWNDPIPSKWIKLKKGETVDNHGIYDRHFIYYRTSAPAGCMLEVGRLGRGVVNGSAADTVLVSVGGKLLPIQYETNESAFYRLPGDSLAGKDIDVVMLFENRGLHHHTNQAVEKFWHIGPTFVRSGGRELALRYAHTERARGLKLSSSVAPSDLKSASNESEPLLKWYKYSFTTSSTDEPLHLEMQQYGNGFIYLNGHCIGRCWEQGPQRRYYLPECWIYRDKPNVLVVSLRPTNQGAEIRSLKLD